MCTNHDDVKSGLESLAQHPQLRAILEPMNRRVAVEPVPGSGGPKCYLRPLSVLDEASVDGWMESEHADLTIKTLAVTLGWVPPTGSGSDAGMGGPAGRVRDILEDARQATAGAASDAVLAVEGKDALPRELRPLAQARTVVHAAARVAAALEVDDESGKPKRLGASQAHLLLAACPTRALMDMHAVLTGLSGVAWAMVGKG